MNKFGIYFTYWADKYVVDYSIFIKRAADLGFDSLGIRASGLLHFSKDKLVEIKNMASDLNLNLTFGIGFSDEYDLSSDCEQTRKNGIAYAKKVLSAIYAMKGRLLNGVYYASWLGELPEGVKDKRPYVERSQEGMKQISSMADDMGITCCLEIVNRYETFLLNTAEEAVDYVKQIGCRNVKILLDTFHMSVEEDSIVNAFRTVGEYLGHVHVAERNRNVPGKGDFDWEAVFNVLKEINYKGIIEMEPFIRTGNEISKEIRLWRDLSNEADDRTMDSYLTESLRFLKQKWINANEI